MTKNKLDTICFSEIETQLINDTQGLLRDKLIQEFFVELIRLKTIRDKGCASEEFKQVEALILAVSAAGDLVAKTWDRHHKKIATTS